ncbi:MAG: ABC transporter permease [Rhabdochlamydiaceae bacterium]|jgi:ABC-2 type transport system permease protein
MRTWMDIYLLSMRCIKISIRNPIFLFMGVITPLLYLTFFSPLLDTLAINSKFSSGNVLDLFVPGMLPYIAFTTGLFAGFGTIDELRSGLIERLRVTPVCRFALLAGPVIHDVCQTLFQSILFVLIAIPFGFRGNITGLAILFVLLILLTLIASSFGNAMGVITKSEDRFAPITHGISLPVLLLSGALLPIALAPLWLKTIAHCNPVYYVVEASRSLAQGHFMTFEIASAFGILVFFTILTMYWATNVFKKAIA